MNAVMLLENNGRRIMVAGKPSATPCRQNSFHVEGEGVRGHNTGGATPSSPPPPWSTTVPLILMSALGNFFFPFFSFYFLFFLRR